ncbi:MAG: efflux RND transporter permease subunit [Chitinophagales bacterium]
MLQANAESRNDEQSLNGISVRNAQGQMIPISQFVELKKVSGPQSISRFNLYNSASLSGRQTKDLVTVMPLKL